MEWAGVAAFITALVGVWKVFDDRATKKNTQALQLIENKIDSLAKEYAIGQRQDKLSIMRLELMVLMRVAPDNVVEIEKVAKVYFGSGGDWYMTTLYSNWAKEHGGDITFIIDNKEKNNG